MDEELKKKITEAEKQERELNKMSEEITKDTIILEDEENARTVRLFGDYSSCSIRETIAHFGVVSARIITFQEDKMPITLSLNIEAIQAFVDGWTQWQADLQAKAEAEKQRVQAVIIEAMKIAEHNPGIKVEEQGEGDNTTWLVSVPDAGWSHPYPAYIADNFLGQVKQALDVWMRHQKELIRQEQFLAQALELAQAIPDIQLNETEHSTGYHKKKWNIVVPGIFVGKGWAYNGEQLYDHIKKAYRAYSGDESRPAIEELDEHPF